MYGKRQEPGPTKSFLLCILAIWGQHPAIWFFTFLVPCSSGSGGSLITGMVFLGHPLGSDPKGPVHWSLSNANSELKNEPGHRTRVQAVGAKGWKLVHFLSLIISVFLFKIRNFRMKETWWFKYKNQLIFITITGGSILHRGETMTQIVLYSRSCKQEPIKLRLKLKCTFYYDDFSSLSSDNQQSSLWKLCP